MPVPFLNLKKQYAQVGEEIEASVLKVLRNGIYCLGPEVESFEQNFADYCGVQHAVGVNSGTSALHLALLAAGIGPGDEVIVPAMTFAATAAAVGYAGARAVVVDVDSDYYTMDPGGLSEALTEKTKAIIPVHLYGQCADMDAILSFAKEHNLLVVEDAAQAHGATFRGRRAGSMGDLACFSFYPGKNLGACGEAGVVLSNNEDFIRRIKAHRDWGQYEKGRHELQGFNYRMDAIQGAVLGVKLKYIDEWTEGRRAVAKRYDTLLQAEGALPDAPKVREGGRHVYHVYGVMVENRKAIQAVLNSRGVASGVHYPVPIHLHECFSGLGYKRGDFPCAEAIADRELSLPVFPEMTEDEMLQVMDSLREAVG